MALDFPVGTDFPANGDQIPDGHVYEGFYWDEATGVWKRVCERDKIGDCLDDDAGETVCDKLDEIQREIVELEEEIDAIATSVDRGTWDWAFTVSNYLDPLPAGKFYMVDGNNGLVVTPDYENVTKVIFSKTDAEGDSHTFSDDMVDKVLMLFDRPDDDFLESVITAVDEPNGANYAIIDVTHIQSLGGPTNKADAEGRYKARLNIFDQPTGGSAGEYVKKMGDDMVGRLRMERDLETVTFEPPTDLGEAHIRFRNTKADNTENTAALFQPGPQDAIVSTTEFLSKGDFTTTSYLKACWFYTDTSGDERRTNKQAQIYFHGSQTESTNGAQYGALKFGNNDRFRWTNTGGLMTYGTPSSTNRNAKLTWGSGGVTINKPVSDGSAATGFTIKGTINKDGYANQTDTSKLEYNADLLSVYHNNNKNDAVNYSGKIVANSNNIVTVKWIEAQHFASLYFQCNDSGRSKGDMWYCANDLSLYIKVSN